MSELQSDITIINKLGLHARASAKLVNLAGPYRASILLRCNGKEANAKSIMSVMMLAAVKGTQLQIRTDGEDADEAMQAVVDLINDRFGEDE
tara:strand:+ start:1676 stop:1951 length:276 start_codon:yes stop_codon:yes gene_type:complete